MNIKSNIYINSKKEINDKDPKFKIGGIVIISKYKNIIAKGYFPNWSEEVFIITNVINAVLWTERKSEEIVETFGEKKKQNLNPKGLRVEKVIKIKGDK